VEGPPKKCVNSTYQSRKEHFKSVGCTGEFIET
jgi:hypothetical protein